MKCWITVSFSSRGDVPIEAGLVFTLSSPATASSHAWLNPSDNCCRIIQAIFIYVTSNHDSLKRVCVYSTSYVINRWNVRCESDNDALRCKRINARWHLLKKVASSVECVESLTMINASPLRPNYWHKPTNAASTNGKSQLSSHTTHRLLHSHINVAQHLSVMLACMYTCVVLISSNVRNLLQTLVNRARVNVRSCTMENASSLDALMQNFLLFIFHVCCALMARKKNRT